MPETRWTPGPWDLLPHPDEWNADLQWVTTDRGLLAAVHRKSAPPGEFEANAHLIASAPDLYEALEQMVGAYETVENDDEALAAKRLGAWMDAQRALARARGEEVPGAIRCLDCGQTYDGFPDEGACVRCMGPVSQLMGEIHVGARARGKESDDA